MTEVWKSIPGYEDIYQVSDLGRIRRIPKNYSLNKPRVLKPCSRKGYHFVCLSRNNKTKQIGVHRLVMLAFVGKSDLQVNHIDANRVNNRLDNLEYVTNHQNIEHQKKIGHLAKGVNASQVRQIRKLLETGLSQTLLAKMYGVSRNAIYNIKYLKTWKHV